MPDLTPTAIEVTQPAHKCRDNTDREEEFYRYCESRGELTIFTAELEIFPILHT